MSLHHFIVDTYGCIRCNHIQVPKANKKHQASWMPAQADAFTQQYHSPRNVGEVDFAIVLKKLRDKRLHIDSHRNIDNTTVNI